MNDVLAGVLGITSLIAIYAFIAYILYKIGKKLGSTESYWMYWIPIYNIWLLMRPIGLSGWLLLAIFVPFISFIAIGYIYGQIAKNLGKNAWLYGITILLLGFPILILAFDSSKKINGRAVDIKTWEPDYVEKLERVLVKLKATDPQFPTIKVTESQKITLGRDRGNDIVINNRYLSSMHIEVELRDDVIYVTDVDSTNGSYIEGDKLEAYEAMELGEGESLVLGSEEVVYTL